LHAQGGKLLEDIIANLVVRRGADRVRLAGECAQVAERAFRGELGGRRGGGNGRRRDNLI
jgi:hypothetical protein